MEDFQQCAEKDLLRMIRESVPDAFRELISRYLWLVHSKAAQFSGPAAPERDDLLQEGFFALYGAAISYDETKNASFSTYAGTCVYNRMADCARRHGNKRNRPLNESLSLDSEAAAFLAVKTSTEDLVEAREQLEALFRRLDKSLSATERRALALYLSGCPRQELSSRSGMELKAFDNALYRVRQKLKQFR